MVLRPAGGKGGGEKGFVEQGVEMAYRVIEEFMQRGRQAAGRTGTAWRKSEEGMQNNQPNMASVMMAYWMDMSRMWLGMMSPFMTPGARPFGQGAFPFPQPGFGQPAYGQPTYGTPAAEPSAAEGRVRVAVELHAEHPAEVTVDLQPQGAHARRLSVRPLQPTLGDKPALAGVDITHQEDGLIRLQVKVPAGQPGGVYTGPIVTMDGNPVGTVTVKLHEPHRGHGSDKPANGAAV